MFVKTAILMFAAAGLAGAAAAPDFHLQDAKGRTVSLSRYRGKVVVLDFWATWCHGCKTEIPWFMEFAKRYGHRGLAVIGVAMDEDGWKSVAPYVHAKKMNYPVVVGNDAVARDYGAAENLPVTLLIDRQGNVAESHTGVVDRAALEERIRELLAARPSR
jgi:cytochrome c biogenesis protein CcmG/thiol:disulfide interchange protein DsbE